MNSHIKIEKHVISILVDNEFGALARIVGVFSARGYNIESLSVAIIDHDRNLSKINIVTNGTNETVALITKLLHKIIPVHKAISITNQKHIVERALCLCKICCTGDKRIEALSLARTFLVNIIDSSDTSFIFEIYGTQEKIDAFINLMKPLGLVEISQTGVVAMVRGNKSTFAT